MESENSERDRQHQTHNDPQRVSASHSGHSDAERQNQTEDSKRNSRRGPEVNFPWSFDAIAFLVMLATFGSTYYACQGIRLTQRSIELAARAWVTVKHVRFIDAAAGKAPALIVTFV